MRLRIGKHDIPQGRPVEMSVLRQDRTTKPLDQSLQRRLSGLDYVACELIGVNDRNPEGSEELGCGRFAAGNAAGEPYTEWSATHGKCSQPRGEPAEVGGHDFGT